MVKATFLLSAFGAAALFAADQTVIGAGNALAEQIAAKSALVQSAKRTLVNNAQGIQNSFLRNETLDAIANPGTCVTHRVGVDDNTKNAIVQQLINQGLVNPADAAGIVGGVKAGVFPPILKEGTACPQLPLSFNAAPGSAFGGHHSYPGGLPVHEANNNESFINFGNLYRGSYGTTGALGLPAFGVIRGEDRDDQGDNNSSAQVLLKQDLVLGAPMWHDWAKTMVFQWNADGTEFTELNFGGTGANDNFGTPGDSRTGGHHIISIAETMARGLSPLLVITQASAHSAPSLGNEFKVVNWLRAAAIMAQVDPVAKGYLVKDSKGNLRLPPLAALDKGVNLLAAGQTNLLIEYQIHNLSDSDFVNSIPAVTQVQVLLQQIAPSFGYDPADVARFNNFFRN